ncbi:unnamed protein product [Pylaiella littoralis]
MDSSSSSSATMATTGAVAALAVYMGVVQLLRFRRIWWMKRSLASKADAGEVFRQMAHLEFPFMVGKSLEFALFSTYAVPSISGLLHKTGEFRKHVGKRYDDTDLILREYYENGTDTNRSTTAMARTNAIHGIYAKEISNADMLFTLSLFVTEPAVWINRRGPCLLFGWRRCTDFEKEVLLIQMGEMGKSMGIKGVEAWKTWEDAYAFQTAYAEEHFRFASSNSAIAGVTVDLFVSPLPKPFQDAARWCVYALIEPPLLKAFGFPQAPLLLQWFLKATFLLRAAVIRFLMPPRPDFLDVRRTSPSDDAKENSADVLLKPNFCPFQDAQLGCLFYKNGYKIGELGTAVCPPGRLDEGLPSYTGSGGGGSGSVICKADGSPLELFPTPSDNGENNVGQETKKSA